MQCDVERYAKVNIQVIISENPKLEKWPKLVESLLPVPAQFDEFREEAFEVFRLQRIVYRIFDEIMLVE